MDNPQIKTEKLLKYGKKQLTDKGVDTQATTIREVLDDISNVKAEEPTQYGAYNIEVIHKDDGTQELHITDAVEKPVDALQARVNMTDGCVGLFCKFRGDNIDFAKNLDTSNVTNMSFMFNQANKIETLDFNFDTSNVTDMSHMFSLGYFTEEGEYNTKKTESSLTSLTFGEKFSTKNATNMTYMFAYVPNVELDLSKFDTSNVTKMSSMFYYSKISSIDLSKFNTTNTTNISSMFRGCSELKSLDLSNFDISNSKLTSFYYLFSGCTNLETLTFNWDTSKIQNWTNAFSNCKKLKTLPPLDLSHPNIGCNGIFYGCDALENLTLKNVKPTIQIASGTSYGHLLTLDTLINTIKELWDYSGGSTTYKLAIGNANLEKIKSTYVKLITPTEEQIATDPNITSKLPCVVCDSTEEGAMLISEYAYLKMWSIV